MKNLYLARNKLGEESQKLKTMSLNHSLSFEKGTELQKVQDEKYQKFKFYNEIIKELNNEKETKHSTK